jgi:hypothetical protein
MGASFLWKRTPDPMRRLGVGILFGTLGLFLQSITEWVFHQTAIFFTFNILLGVLASLYYVKRQARRQTLREQEENAEDGSDEEVVEPEFTEEYARSSSS